MQLEWAKFYIVKISFFEGNPIHETIAFVREDKEGKELIKVFNGFECEDITVKDLKYFEVVEQINIIK